MSIHEESTLAAVQPMMGVFNNLVMYDQHVPQNSLQSIVPDLATELVVERGRDRADLPAAPGRQMARRQAVHRQGRQMHLGFAAGHGEDKLRVNPRKAGTERRRGHDEGRLRGHLPSEAAAAGIARAAGFRLVADLSLPRPAARHAPASDRHRPVQIRRVQAERTHQGDAQSGLLEDRTGPISTASNTRSSRSRRPRNLAFFAGKFDMILAERDDPDC